MGQHAQRTHRDAIHDRATSAVVDPAQLFLDDREARWTGTDQATRTQRGERR